MLQIGKLHAVLVHFPIGLVLAAAGAEFLAILTCRAMWRTTAVANVRAGAAAGAVTAIAGWLLASAPFIEPTRSLTLHRWTGLAGAAAATAAALISIRPSVQFHRSVFTYESARFGAAAFVAIAGHLGGTLVWGSGFLWP